MAPVLYVWDKYKGRNVDDERVARVLRLQVHMQDILSDHVSEAFLPDRAAKDFNQTVKRFLVEYSLLANAADEQGLLLFTVAPKHHHLWHLGERSLFMNPRRANCMLDEDYVGKIKEVVHSTVHGTEAHNVPENVLEKVLWGKYLLIKMGL